MFSFYYRIGSQLYYQSIFQPSALILSRRSLQLLPVRGAVHVRAVVGSQRRDGLHLGTKARNVAINVWKNDFSFKISTFIFVLHALYCYIEILSLFEGFKSKMAFIRKIE